MTEKEFLVSSHMQQAVKTVPTTATLKEVVVAMLHNKTNGMIVVDTSGKVAGIISVSDIIHHIVPDYLESDKALANFETSDLFVQRIHGVANDSVSSFMTSKVHSIKATDTLMEAATFLTGNRVRQLPVVDDQNNLVGYINRTDIKRAIAQILGLSEAGN